MADVGLGLSYWLPQTQFKVSIIKRNVVETDDAGSFVHQVADVRILPDVVEDPSSRQSLQIDAGLLEKISLAVNLDDRGFIQSVNGEAGKDLAPVVSLIGKGIGLAGAIIAFGVRPFEEAPTESLETQWAKKHQSLAERAIDLEKTVERLLREMGAQDASPDQVVQIGTALKVVQEQLAAISQVRRAWIASHNEDLASESQDFGVSDLLLIDGVDFPAVLDAPRIPPGMQTMANRFGVLIAIVDRNRGDSNVPAEQILVDKLALRRSRTVTVGVYLRTDAGGWELDEESLTTMDVVDGFSDTDYLPLDGSWLRTKTFELSYHPDMSVKTFGMTTTSSASAIATSVGEVFDAAGAARKQISERPSGVDEQLQKAKTQLDLLKTANEYEVLAATSAKAAELAALEQQKKLRQLQR